MTEIKKGVPIPAGTKSSKHIDEAIRSMVPGDSFDEQQKGQSKAFRRFGKINGWKTKIRTVKGVKQCWRDS